MSAFQQWRCPTEDCGLVVNARAALEVTHRCVTKDAVRPPTIKLRRIR